MKTFKKLPLIFSVVITASTSPAAAVAPPATIVAPPVTTSLLSVAPLSGGHAAVVATPTYIPGHLRYKLPINLGTLGTVFKYSLGYSLNNSSQVVGITSTAPDAAGYAYSKAFIWQNDVMKLVPMVSGIEKNRELKDINNAGLAVGSDMGVAFTYQNGTSTPLQHLSNNKSSQAYGISDTGIIVGESKGNDNKNHAVVWQNGTITNIGTLSGYPGSLAYAISDSGAYIVGWAQNAPPLRAAIWDQNHVIQPLNATNVSESVAISVNNFGLPVGQADFTNDTVYAVPVRWVNGQIQKLSDTITLGYASGINNKGQIVGAIDLPYHSAFLWDNGTLYDLNQLIPPNSGWLLTAAWAINDHGEITGVGIFNGKELGFLLKPLQ